MLISPNQGRAGGNSGPNYMTGYVTILRNKLHGPNRLGSGPQGKYMAGDLVDDTMEDITTLQKWVAAGVASASSEMHPEEAAKVGQDLIDAQNTVTRKAGAEQRMEMFDSLPEAEREVLREHGDEAVEVITEGAIEEPPKRKRGRPRKDAQ